MELDPSNRFNCAYRRISKGSFNYNLGIGDYDS